MRLPAAACGVVRHPGGYRGVVMRRTLLIVVALLTLAGRLAERTSDSFAQDAHGSPGRGVLI